MFRKHLITTLLLAAISHTACATEATVNEAIKPSPWRAEYHWSAVKDYPVLQHISAMTIYDAKTGAKIQTIAQKDLPSSITDVKVNLDSPQDKDSVSSATFFDVNFDGYEDMQLGLESFAGPNTQSDYWLYDPTQKQFVLNAELSGLTNVGIDEKNKTITSDNSCCAGTSQQNQIYQWKGDHLVLVKELERKMIEEGEAKPKNVKAPKGCKQPLYFTNTETTYDTNTGQVASQKTYNDPNPMCND